MIDLKTQIITRVLDMKNGNDKCTPQPDCARAELDYFNKLLPWLELNQAVKQAMKGKE